MERYYSDDVEMQENETPPRKGKETCIDYEKAMLDKVKDLKSELIQQAIDEKNNVVFGEWKLTITYSTGTKILLPEVSVQQWRDGKIFYEKFYYKEFIKL